MANYEVRYDIQVNTGQSVQNINQFVAAVDSMQKSPQQLLAVANRIQGINAQFAELAKVTPSLNIDVTGAMNRLDRVYWAIDSIKREAATLNAPSRAVVDAGKMAKSVSKAVSDSVNNIFSKMKALRNLKPSPKLDFSDAIGALKGLETALERVQSLSKINISVTSHGVAQAINGLAGGTGHTAAAGGGAVPVPPVVPVGGTAGGTGSARGTGGTSTQRTTARPAAPAASRTFHLPWNPNRPMGGMLTYTPDAHSTLGNVYAGTGMVAAAEMVKGMGIAYGMSAVIEGVKSVFEDAANYDNITRTTQNILATKEVDPGFTSRFRQMNELMRQVGMETKFTAPEVADAGRYLAMAGLSTKDITAAIRPVADIALIGDTELGETADVITNIMTAYQIPAEKMNRVADIMTATFTSSNVTLMEMADSFRYSATLFKKAGVPFEVASASLGILGNAGIKGSQAGTTMRTILANIYKPTGKQQEAWDAIGVSRTDEKGQIRPITDIFRDLNEKNINVQSAYGLFHKTAAQGAVALVQAVDEWNSIITNNFLSESLARKLAREKTQTIQGLWAQITSAFTESGMRGFEALQGSIRDLLGRALEVMRSPEFAGTLRRTMEIVIGMAEPVATMFKMFVNGFHTLNEAMGGFLLNIIKLQMYVSAINKLQISIISMSKGVKAIMSVGIAQAAMYPVNLLGDWLYAKMAGIPYVARAAQVSAEAAAGAATAATTQANLGWAGVLRLLAIHPATWIIGSVAALGTLAYAWSSAKDKAQEYLGTMEMMNGINMTDTAAKMDKYFAIMYDRQKELNDKVAEYIRLRQIEMGLVNEVPNVSDPTPGKDKFPKLWESLSTKSWLAPDMPMLEAHVAKMASQWFAGSGWQPTISGTYGAPNSPVTGMSSAFTNPFGGSKSMVRFMGRDYALGDQSESRKLKASVFFTELGGRTGEGTEAQYIIDEFVNQYANALTPVEWDKVTAQIMKRISEIEGRVDTSLMNLSGKEQENMAFDQYSKRPDYIKALTEQVQRQLGLTGTMDGTAAGLRQLRLYMDKAQPSEAMLMETLAKVSGNPAFNPDNGLFSGDWAKNMFGYDGKGILGTPTLTTDQAIKNMLVMYQDLYNIAKTYPLLREKIADILKLPYWKYRTPASVSGGSVNFLSPLDPSIMPEATDATGAGGDPLQTLAQAVHNGSDQSKYKSHYNLSSAPKQVIVTIQNLMRVDNQTIDMSDPRQVAAADNFKERMSEALLEVVQDFSANLNMI